MRIQKQKFFFGNRYILRKSEFINKLRINTDQDYSNVIPFLDLFETQHDMRYVPIPAYSKIKISSDSYSYCLAKYILDLVHILCITYKYIYHISKTLFLI